MMTFILAVLTFILAIPGMVISRVNNEGSVTNLLQTSFYDLLWYI